MTNSKTIALALLGGVALMSTAVAQQPSSAPASKPMMQEGTSNMGMMGMMGQMSAMMDNCNKMMSSMMDKGKGSAPGEQTPARKGG